MNSAPPTTFFSHARSHARAGWTTMEVALTVAIVLVLLGLAIPAFVKTRPQRQRAQCLAQLDELASACRHYAIERGGFPGTIEELVPAYLPEVPVCPAGGVCALGTPEGLPPSCSLHAPATSLFADFPEETDTP
ncbi:MAG: hypothetical protein IJT88_01915 [Kiritimatiellae bacterium]|nr:hypothetical protein [Kiritimatiellia bacterium]